MFQAGEKFERQRAAAEGREPRLYHGVFSSHPSPDQREVQAAKGAANIKDAPPGGWIERHDEYLTTINGIAYGSSKAQGIVRDNRFYHADMGITVAFPRGWTIENMRDRLLAFTPKKDALMQVHDRREAGETGAARIPADASCKGASVFKGEPLTGADGMRGLHRRHAQWFAHRQRPRAGALGGGVSRRECFIFAGAEPLGHERCAGSGRHHQVDRADIARTAAIGVSADGAISHQSGEGHRRRRDVGLMRRTCPRTSSRKKHSSSSTRCIRTRSLQPDSCSRSSSESRSRRARSRAVALIPVAGHVRLATAFRAERFCDMPDQKLEIARSRYRQESRASRPFRHRRAFGRRHRAARQGVRRLHLRSRLRRNRRGRKQDHLHRRRRRRAHASRLSRSSSWPRRARSSRSAIYC